MNAVCYTHCWKRIVFSPNCCFSFSCTANRLTAIQSSLACVAWNAAPPASAAQIILTSKKCTSSAAIVIAENSNDILYCSQKRQFLNQKILPPYLKEFRLIGIAVGLEGKNFIAVQPVGWSINTFSLKICLPYVHTNYAVCHIMYIQTICDYVQYSHA